jgi:hypothetical protein
MAPIFASGMTTPTPSASIHSAKRAEWTCALTSLPPAQADVARLEQLWRGHWQIENGVHDGCAMGAT